MAESFSTIFPRLVALMVGAVVGFLSFGPLGMFGGALLGLLVLVVLNKQGEDAV